MSPRSPASLNGGSMGSEDGEKVTRYAPHRKDYDVDSSARLASSSRASRTLARDALMTDRNAHFASYGQDRDRSRSPFRRDRSGSRSPYRADKDSTREKRRHQDDHYGKNASDPRRHKVYEDRPPRGHRHSAYQDPDRPAIGAPDLPHGDRREQNRRHGRDSHGERLRDRSRSPYRAPPPQSRQEPAAADSGRGGSSFSNRETNPRNSSGNGDSKVSTSPSEKAAKAAKAAAAERDQQGGKSAANSDAKSSEQAEEAIEPEKQLSEAELIEQRRKRREAIKKKHATANANDSLLRAALESNLPSVAATTPKDESGQGSEQQSPPSSANSPGTPGTPRDGISAPGSPAEFAGMKDEDLANPLQVNAAADEQGQSAADYDPNADANEDRPEFKRQDLHDSGVSADQVNRAPHLPSTSKKTADDFDMFADDDDIDMFAAEEEPAKQVVSKQARALDESLLDNWDYPDGHYRIINGELLDGRYAVEQQIGKGTFATVVRARDSKTGNNVAIKIACRNDTMLKAGQKEMQFLERLNERDPDDKRHIIRLLGDFTHKGHLCLVFEGLQMDLREVLKKFGRDVGINLDAVKMYAYQMFQALLLLKSAEVLHADLKPDNILINEKRTLIKICDFGTATLHQDAELTPYLVSRFYRAPEVILGMDFDYAIDMWAIGCTLYELYAGRILFNGSDNNNMLRVIQECRGKLPNRLIKRAKLADKYFDENFTFYAFERDKMTGNLAPRAMHFSQGLPGRDLKSRLGGNVNKMKPDVLREHNAFVDLLDKCLQLDPEKRIKPKDALYHPFFNRPSQAKSKASVTPAPIFRPVTVQHSG